MNYKTQADGRILGKDIPHLVAPEFQHLLFDSEEVEAMERVENGEDTPISSKELDKVKSQLKGAKLYSIDKNGNRTLVTPEERTQISLRLYNSDIAKLKLLAKEEGMPYQTLITSILHKVANKKLKTILE